jgi:tryptophanyl-tRNA synthetase
MIVPGTDGQKMSKSYNNFIDIFLPEKELKKQIGGIVTDSTPLEEPKDPDTDNVYAIYKLIASPEQTASLREKYLAGGFGYGHAKNELYELILEKFRSAREKFNYLMQNHSELEQQLKTGEVKARSIAQKKISLIREKLGFEFI